MTLHDDGVVIDELKPQGAWVQVDGDVNRPALQWTLHLRTVLWLPGALLQEASLLSVQFEREVADPDDDVLIFRKLFERNLGGEPALLQ